MKVTKYFFPVYEILKCDLIQMKAAEQYFPLVLWFWL